MQTGAIDEYTNVFFDKLDEGQYEIYVYANYNELKDGIKEGFKVVSSSVYFNNTEYYKINGGTILDKTYSNAVIAIFNESKSDFYKS